MDGMICLTGFINVFPGNKVFPFTSANELAVSITLLEEKVLLRVVLHVQTVTYSILMLQGPAQAQNLRDSLAEAKSDIVVKVRTSLDSAVQHISALMNCQNSALTLNHCLYVT
jgi:hypothetical protein